MSEPMTAERLAEQVSAAFAETIGVNLTPDELAHVMEPVRAEVSRLAAEREEALKAVSEHFAAMDPFVNLGPTVTWLLQRDDEHVKQLAALAAEIERLKQDAITVYENCFKQRDALQTQLAAAAATIERQRALIKDARGLVLDTWKYGYEAIPDYRWSQFEAAAARELEGACPASER